MRPILVSVSALVLMTSMLAGAAPQGAERQYTFLLAGNRAGTMTVREAGEGGRQVEASFEFNDRGRGPKVTERAVFGASGLPERVEIEGIDYWKKPVTETFQNTGGKASWSNGAEKGSGAGKAAFYLGLNGVPEETARLAAALLAAPEGRLELLPAGEARIERAGSTEVKTAKESRKVDLYAISGLGFEPTFVWLDADRRLFASYSGWATTIRAGWEDVVPRIAEVQDAAAATREKDLAARLARRPAQGLVVKGARLFDPATGKVAPAMTVVVSGNKVQAVGKDGEVAAPAGAEVIDARGRMLLPGLWDMHAHLGTVDGILNLAAGVTTVRDMANETDQLLALRDRFDKGEALGPRVILAGFMDGPGPFAGPTKVLISKVDEALAAVDRYAKLGYSQVKLYSSLDPALVAPIVERAHRHGLRVSGHIPNGMSAEQAVRAGFDEIQHTNFLFLNFLSGVDTRTPARFTEVAARGAELDLGSERVRAFLRLLQERGVTVDPTLATFEGMFTGRSGEIDPAFATVADRLPSQVRRGFLSGGLQAPEGMEQRYRDFYRAMIQMVGALHKAGVTLVAGTDATPGFALHRELELYADAGIPAPEILRIATLGAAKVMKRDQDLGTVAPGKLADFILVDGDPTARIADIRRVVLTVKDGAVYDPAALYTAIGVKPAV
ncbi:MAG TPA: amidohydrolase family protein [Thermoanaerobaculia bacterium]|nr:amidohydrolase family protein [Thermoanaerobaculia bacterium]